MSYGPVGYPMDMGRKYASCRVCKVHRDVQPLSSRGLCSTCAMNRSVIAAASSIAVVQAQKALQGAVAVHQSRFASLDSARDT